MMENLPKVIFLFIWIMTTIVVSAGSLNSGIPFYMIFGIINFALNGLVIYKVSKDELENN